MRRPFIVVLSLLILLGAVGCTGEALTDPPVVAPSATSSVPPTLPLATLTATPLPATSTVPPSPTATPEPTPSPLPVDRSVPQALDSAREIAPEHWSPSGRFLAYAVPLGDTNFLSPTDPAQVKLVDTAADRICTVPTDGARGMFLPRYLWLSGDRLLFRHVAGHLAVWETPCEGEPRPLTGATPSVVSAVAGAPDFTRWLVLSEEGLWLLDGDTLQFGPVEGVTYGIHPGASWSPDGNHLVLVQEGRAYRIDPQGGQATELAAWDYQPEAGSENFPASPPQWIDNQRFLVPTVPLGSPQLIDLDGSWIDVSVTYFGLEPVGMEGFPRGAFLLPGQGENWHILLALYGDGSGPAYQLYHNETQTIEQLTLPSETSIFNFIDPVAGGTHLLFNELGSSDRPPYWLRALHPMGSEWRQLAEGSFRATVSPDGQHVAISGAEGVSVYDIEGRPVATWSLGAEGAWLLWSPTGSQVATTTLGADGQQLYLLELDQP